MEATVAVVRTRPETVLQDYERLLLLAGLTPIEATRCSAAVCVDHVRDARSAMPAAGSPPWQVEGVAQHLLASGYSAGDLQIFAPMAVRSDSELLFMWTTMLERIGLQPRQQVAVSFDARLPLLVLAALRTDRVLGVTGCLGAMAAHLLPLVSRRALAGQPMMLLDAWRKAGDAAVLGGVIDATVCGAGPDAWSLQPVVAHLLLAGRDPVAVDAVAAGLAGFDPTTLPLVQAASAAGLGCGDPRRIDIVGDVSDGLPHLGLAPAARYRGLAAARSWLSRRERLGIARYLPWVFLRTRRDRQRFEATVWGRLQHDYCGRGVRAGRDGTTTGRGCHAMAGGSADSGCGDS